MAAVQKKAASFLLCEYCIYTKTSAVRYKCAGIDKDIVFHIRQVSKHQKHDLAARASLRVGRQQLLPADYLGSPLSLRLQTLAQGDSG